MEWIITGWIFMGLFTAGIGLSKKPDFGVAHIAFSIFIWPLAWGVMAWSYWGPKK